MATTAEHATPVPRVCAVQGFLSLLPGVRKSGSIPEMRVKRPRGLPAELSRRTQLGRRCDTRAMP